MPFVIRTIYRNGQDALRDKLLLEHVAYLDQHVETLLAAGGLVTDDNRQVQAAMYILDVEDRASAEAFAASEPFVRDGLIERVEIQRWRKSYFDRQRLLGDPMRTSSTAIKTSGPPPLS